MHQIENSHLDWDPLKCWIRFESIIKNQTCSCELRMLTNKALKLPSTWIWSKDSRIDLFVDCEGFFSYPDFRDFFLPPSWKSMLNIWKTSQRCIFALVHSSFVRCFKKPVSVGICLDPHPLLTNTSNPSTWQRL